MLYCLLLRYPNFQKDTLLIKKVILHERINVQFSHVVRLIHSLKFVSFSAHPLWLSIKSKEGNMDTDE